MRHPGGIMKRFLTGLASAIIFFSAAGIMHSQDTAPQNLANPYTQLLGFKAGGEYFIGNSLSDWSTGVFFEDVISPLFGVEIELTSSSIPITNYTPNAIANPFSIGGIGQRNYIEMSSALKVYIKSLSLAAGITYNSFSSGYIIENSQHIYVPITDQEVNFFSFFAGPELTAQISSDLYTKVGVRFIYGLVDTYPNFTMGVRFYISFAYGI